MNFLDKKKGFTLIELLVVIAIIGVLATIVVGSFNSAKEKARDVTRKTDLDQIRKAIIIWSIDNNNDHLMENSGCGSGGGSGYGFFVADYGAPGGSIKDCLVNGDYISNEISDPTGTGSYSSSDSHYYLKVNCGDTSYLMANLEATPNPSADIVSCTNWDTLFGMDYFIEIN